MMSAMTSAHRYVVLVLTHDRPEHLHHALESLFSATGSSEVPIVISQDGDDQDVRGVVEDYSSLVASIVHTSRPAERGDGHPSPVHGYRCIAAHYRWALNQVFALYSTDAVVVIEDDLIVASDALQFFDACQLLLTQDASVWAVSAWNDNGQPEFVFDAERVVRSDWFPNLGVLISRSLWAELEPDWPEIYWDDWIREPTRRRGRVTLRPEISRVRHAGATGSSFGEYFDEHTGRVALPRQSTGFEKLDVATLHMDAYDSIYLERVEAAAPVTIGDVDDTSGDVRVAYRNLEEFSALANRIGLMADVRHGTPRTAYRGIVECRRGEDLLFLAPSHLT